MAKIHEVEIDGMMTPVDPDEWAADPQAVIDQVRHNREAVDMRSDTGDSDEADAILKNEV